MTSIQQLPGSIRRRFSTVSVVTLVSCAAAAGAVLYELHNARQASRDFIQVGAARLELARRMESKLYRAESAENQFLSRADPADLEQFRALIGELRSDGQRLQKLLDEPAKIDAQLQHIGEYAQLVEREAEVTLGKIAINDPAAFRALLVRRGEALGAAQNDTEQTLELALAAGPVYAGRVERSFFRLIVWMLALLGLVAAGALATFSVGNRIVRQVVSMATAIGEITEAENLDRRLPVESADELGTLSLSFNSLLSAQQASARELEQAARRDKEKADTIEAAFRELSATTEALRKSQQKLMESDKLATIGQLSAGVAHEVNNPATSVLGNLEFLRLELEPLLEKLQDAKAAEDISGALNDSIAGMSRISSIARDLGAFARKSDEVELVPITEPVEVAIKMANFEVKYRAQVIRDFQPLPPISGNRGRLQQVFLNLVINAAHAIPKGDVAHNFIRVSTRLADGKAEIKIADSGGGIAPENLSRIFDPFFTTKPQGQGTGLGLAITNDIVHQHGGEISVASELGRGTTFTLLFPVPKNPQ
jgi:signal transduction histidine kinase